MNTRVRTALQTMRAPAPLKHDKVVKIASFEEMGREKKAEMQVGGSDAPKVPNRRHARRERKIALQQDVDKLKKKLRHEENVHRALERAFTRPLGALPRLPPYLPSHTLELLAEVAVLEEEVVRLEDQVVNFRQGLYQEAIYISSRKTKESASDSHCNRYSNQDSKSFEQLKSCSQSANVDVSLTSNPSPSMRWSSSADPNCPSSKRFINAKRPLKKPDSCLREDRLGKENQSNTIAMKNVTQQSPVKKVPRCKMFSQTEKQSDAQKKFEESSEERIEDSFCSTSEPEGLTSGPNKLSEDILRCLMSVFSSMSMPKSTAMMETSPTISSCCDSMDDTGFRDPYGISSEFGIRDIGPYKKFHVVDTSSVDLNLVTRSPSLTRRLKLLLRKLVLVDLSGLTHQQKLAFWINIYNSCMMNAFLEQGIPGNPQMVIVLMTKAMINVGGHLLSAMAIEHFILRLPYHSKQTCPKGLKSEQLTTRGIFGLDWPEPLVTFALSCGSWSSPAVRVYTASQVEKELEAAKRDYLQASVGITLPNRLAIPKLLDWYLLDFAKDVESLMDWICLQLPSELRNDAVKCLEMSRSVVPWPIQVMPYEFRFRYLLVP